MSITAGQTILASDFISTSAGAGDVGKVPKLNASGQLDGSFLANSPIVRTYLNAASPATWSKPALLKYVIVEIQAPGGGSAGRTNSGPGGSGGGGGYCRKLILAASLGSTETVTIGAAGTGGAAADGNGGSGGTCSFGAHCSANGGAGGVSNTEGGGDGGTATGGDINITGRKGKESINIDGATFIGGDGGDSVLGHGGNGDFSDTSAINPGEGVAYGGGGGGMYSADTSDHGGKVGGAGIVIVTEYY